MRLVLIVESLKQKKFVWGARDNGLAGGVACECSVRMKQAPRALGARQPGEAIGRSKGPLVYSWTQVPEERGLACQCGVQWGRVPEQRNPGHQNAKWASRGECQ